MFCLQHQFVCQCKPNHCILFNNRPFSWSMWFYLSIKNIQSYAWITYCRRRYFNCYLEASCKTRVYFFSESILHDKFWMKANSFLVLVNHRPPPSSAISTPPHSLSTAEQYEILIRIFDIISLPIRNIRIDSILSRFIFACNTDKIWEQWALFWFVWVF